MQAVLVACLWGAACRHAPPDTGRSSFRVVESSRTAFKSGHADLVEPTQYREAQARHPLVMPIYPPKALKAKVGAATVGVHVTVGVNGVVTDVRPSLLAVTIAPPGFADDFRTAVEAAVRQWRFEPARVDHIETVIAEGRSYQRWAGSESVEAEFDLAFTFTAAGRVEAGASGKY